MTTEEANNIIDLEVLEAKTKHSSKRASSHEVFALLLEEVEEASEELFAIQENVKQLWQAVRSDEQAKQRNILAFIKEQTVKLIKEAAQVGAMIERYQTEVNIETGEPAIYCDRCITQNHCIGRRECLYSSEVN